MRNRRRLPAMGEPESPLPRVGLVEVPYAEVARLDLQVHTRRSPVSRWCRCGERYPCPARERSARLLARRGSGGLSARAVTGLVIVLVALAVAVLGLIAAVVAVVSS